MFFDGTRQEDRAVQFVEELRSSQVKGSTSVVKGRIIGSVW